jgi:hypothetical protein
MGKKPSISRLQARELDKKILPAVKMMSKYIHNTAPDAPEKDFHGYILSAGSFSLGRRKWQLQIRAVCTKKEFVKEEQIHPIIRKGAWLFKLRLWSSAVISKIFKD